MVIFKRQNPKKRNTERRKGSEQGPVQRLDTSGTRCSMSADASLAGVAFLSHKGVLKERCKIERVMKTSTAPFFGLKHRNTRSTILVRQMYETQYIF